MEGREENDKVIAVVEGFKEAVAKAKEMNAAYAQVLHYIEDEEREREGERS